MKILIRQFLGKNHSWSVCGWGIANSLIKSGHEVHLFSTDGIKNLPSNLQNNLIGYVEENRHDKLFGRLPDENYDSQISYTAMKNFPNYLNNGNKNRFGIWCYEWAGKNVLPKGFAKHYKNCDKLLPPSNFAKQVFLDSGVPESSMEVISHGIDVDLYKGTSKYDIGYNDHFKILANIAQPHIRKNIPGLLDAYGKAFTDKDNVVLILKISKSVKSLPLEISFDECFQNFKLKYKNHAKIKIIDTFIPDISSLYRACDAIFSMTYCECFYFPALEAIASGKMSICPNWGGQLDFLNKDNSLLIEGKADRANPSSMYWESNPNAIWFAPDISEAVDKLRYARSNFNEINSLIEFQRENVYEKYSWDNVTSKIIGLCK